MAVSKAKVVLLDIGTSTTTTATTPPFRRSLDLYRPTLANNVLSGWQKEPCARKPL